MIASLSGLLRQKSPDSLVLDVQGVGYEVFISSRTYDHLPVVGETCFLLIHTNVREDAITLFGFERQESKDLFLLLVSVSGVGPKLALAILSGLGTRELTTAISMEDFSRLTAIPGVGKKTAQRLCVELGEKVGKLTSSAVEGPPPATAGGQAPGNVVQDAVSALVNLGYPQQQAWQAVRRVEKQESDHSTDGIAVEELIRLALQGMS